ncbi:hypothetical protein BV898_06876 [Hypsibius exemplaris]|uniref:Hexosyltransferase n=1 Tax=Hypsibius exemplaris TaxID=2072580 RepID=A0A1W0WUX9_HYPEX|nr:hypothetical protein BV898_06876 [Hypsibius exemplaris]
MELSIVALAVILLPQFLSGDGKNVHKVTKTRREFEEEIGIKEPSIDPSSAVNARGRSPYLVLIVISRPEALHERMAIRRTWTKSADSCGIKIIFAFGGFFKLKSLRDDLAAEEAAFKDVLQFDHLRDRYYATYSLVLHALHWARRNHPGAKFFGKANDDVWINFPRLVEFLARPARAKDFILGHFVDSSSQIATELYEDFSMITDAEPIMFAVGHLWIVPVYTLEKVLRVASVLAPNATLVADIVITGEFRRYRKIVASNVADYVNLWDLSEKPGCTVRNYTLLHGVFSQQKYDFDSLLCLSSLTCPSRER